MFFSNEVHILYLSITDVRPEHLVQPALAPTVQVEHHKAGASSYTWSKAAYIILS